MNDWQNTVVATTVSGFLLVVIFLCPWRVESSQEIKWSPIYQPPMSYVRSYDNEFSEQGSSSIKSQEAHIAVGLLALEVLGFGLAGVLLYVLSSNSNKSDEHSHPL